MAARRAPAASSSPGSAPGGHGGVHAPHEAAVDPRELLAALAVAFERAGGTIEIAEVVGGLIDGERLAGVRTADGAELRAGTVVLAAGAWSAAEWLPEEARPPMRPVKGQILTLRRARAGDRCASGSSPASASTSCPAPTAG